jgi:hypothetical protein
LTHSAFISRERANFPIDGDRRLSARNQLSNAMNEAHIKTLAAEHFIQKVLIHPVIGFFKIEFQQYASELLSSQFMDYLNQC